MKKILTFAAILTTAVSCGNLFNENADFEITGRIWSVTGYTSPWQCQEIRQLSYDLYPDDDSKGLIDAEFTFDEGTLTLVFPSGAYRVVNYTQDKENKILTFDGILFYGSAGGPDIKSCHYKMEKLAGKPFLTLYEAEDVENVKIDEGEWRVSMTTTSQRLVFPIAEITFEFGTSYPGNSVECTGSLIWGEPFAANNKTFKFVDEYDLAQVYCGNEWRLPTVEEANLLVGSCTIEKCELDGVHQVGLFYNDECCLFLPAPEMNTVYGFWLADGNAVIYSYTDDNAIAMVSTITSGEEYYILPVKDATE